MAFQRKRVRYAAMVGALALAAAACGGGGDDGNGGGGGGGAGTADNPDYTGGEINVQIGDIQSITPTDTTESEGATIVENVYSGLVKFDVETGDVVYEVAESIETEDNVVWEIELRDDFEFDNGEPVDADAFIRAWNFGAYGPNAQRANSFYEWIDGYSAMQYSADQVDDEGAPVEGAEDPEATELAGLEKTGDYSFTVTLGEPFAGFEVALGHNTYNPMAQECIDDIEACNEQPIGNGPFTMAGPWEHDVQVPLERNENYPGDNPANIDSLIFHQYADLNTAYNDLDARTLDMVRSTPPELREQARAQFGERFIEEATSSYTGLAFPMYHEQYQDVNIRRALSLAINRQEIIDAVFFGANEPADSVVAPVIPGYQEGICEYCDFDPDEAQRLLDEAGGWPEGEALQLHFHPGSGHEEWVEAVGIQIENTLGIPFELRNELEWTEHLNARDDRQMEGPYRSAWIMSYPLAQYYLQPLYHTTGSSSDTGWDNEEFDQKVEEANAADTLDEAEQLYVEAEEILMDDLPTIPRWFGRSSVAYHENVENVIYDVYESNPSWVDLQATQ